MHPSPLPTTAVLTRAARRRRSEALGGRDLDDVLATARKRRRRQAPDQPTNPLFVLLPAALQAELFFEWVNEPRDLAKLEVAAATTATAAAATAVGELRARRVLGKDELAWLRARGVRVRLFAEVRVGSCFFGRNCFHCRMGERYVGNTHRRREWLLNGELHRDGDLPALEEPAFGAPSDILPEGDFDPATAPAPPLVRREWYRYGVLHRGGDLPARQVFEYVDDGNGGGVDWAHPILVEQAYFQRGLAHRDGDEPAHELVHFSNPFQISASYPKIVEWAWYRRGKVHRGGDRPAIVHSDGRRQWYWNGRKHRGGDRPADEYPDGTKEWRRSGKRRRGPGGAGGPTRVSSDGTQTWHCPVRGHVHRGGDLPAIVRPDGSRIWYSHGLRHRDGDRPAIEAVDYLGWFRHDHMHRDGDRAAVIQRCRRGFRPHPRLRLVLSYWHKGWPRACGRQKSYWRARERHLFAAQMLDEANARCAAVAAAVAAGGYQ